MGRGYESERVSSRAVKERVELWVSMQERSRKRSEHKVCVCICFLRKVVFSKG